MMKGMILIALASVLLIAGCSNAPQDIPKADIAQPTQAAPSQAAAQQVPAEPTLPPVDEMVVIDAPEQPSSGVQRVSIDQDASTFEFEGFAPGKSHVGTFLEWEGVLLVEDDVIIGAEGVINPDTVKSDGEKLENHLRSDDFFDIGVFTEIVFEKSSIDYSGSEPVMTGTLSFHGITNEVSFPVTVDGQSVSGDFLLDMTPFGMKYVAVDSEVRISFDMRA